jgi:hypothetical protein
MGLWGLVVYGVMDVNGFMGFSCLYGFMDVNGFLGLYTYGFMSSFFAIWFFHGIEFHDDGLQCAHLMISFGCEYSGKASGRRRALGFFCVCVCVFYSRVL